MHRSISFIVMVCLSATTFAAVADFEDKTLSPNSFYNGSDMAGGFSSQGVQFSNGFDFIWSGFAYSNVNDTTTPGFGNQYAAITGSGFGGAGIYGVGFDSSGFGAPMVITLPYAAQIQNMKITNTTYAYLTIRDGDDGFGPHNGFARQFGDDPNVAGHGNQGFADWFKVTVVGDDGAGNLTAPIDYYLADYRAASNDDDYVINDWRELDLTAMGTIKSLTFTMSSSDSSFGFANTPVYFALDNVTFVPEPGSLVVLGLAGLLMMRGRKHAQ